MTSTLHGFKCHELLSLLFLHFIEESVCCDCVQLSPAAAPQALIKDSVSVGASWLSKQGWI